MQNFAFKFQAVAEKTAKNVRGLLYFAAPCIVFTYNEAIVTDRPHVQAYYFSNAGFQFGGIDRFQIF